ncbi:hypothetical protein K431DRAFT_338352 [Polychaeton citri CBS 116435]|uniref:BTB domain-containing protein n=1 Tax=Polychaeton citri CBS 116435 TaxID=1314669 RepID=A0A9P4Q7M0_9PEZI|nr:hypothetical protein K431DRAFT_338352 [Polychaeton citri CBS 116435]
MSTRSSSTAAEPRERPLYELLSRDMVDLYVGTENTHWILHEKLLCHRSRFFRDIFYNKKGSKNSVYGLPDEDDEPFRLFVGWLYSAHVPPPQEEKDLSKLFDLYLMAEKWEIKQLINDVLEQVRQWYHDTDSWPGLRRVQYVYSNTEQDSPLRQLLVSSIARMLASSDKMPEHWDRALKKNGELAVDIIRCIQKWHLHLDDVPDSRSASLAPVEETPDSTVDSIESESNGVNGTNGGLEEEIKSIKIEPDEIGPLNGN